MKYNIKSIFKFFGRFSFSMAKDIVLLDFFSSISNVKNITQLSFLNILAIALIAFGVIRIVVSNAKLYKSLNKRGSSNNTTSFLLI